ncbi:uncharacterized protein LOC121860235 [Homarus americanus]|uniref:uncharacterized protein LOC121860235 n=1 Tax=Homarus americanus TaxID=6706 RepID=UPI001C45F9C9|nr:uncharacterized protein LOC121860235 [Homarus americanus]
MVLRHLLALSLISSVLEVLSQPRDNERWFPAPSAPSGVLEVMSQPRDNERWFPAPSAPSGVLEVMSQPRDNKRWFPAPSTPSGVQQPQDGSGVIPENRPPCTRTGNTISINGVNSYNLKISAEGRVKFPEASGVTIPVSPEKDSQLGATQEVAEYLGSALMSVVDDQYQRSPHSGASSSGARRVKRQQRGKDTPAAAQTSPAEDEENRASIGGKTPSSQNSEPEGHGGGGQDKGVRKFTGGKVGHEWSDQHLLYNDLFKNYNKHIRPILNHDDVLTVHFEIALFNVLNLSECGCGFRQTS